MSAGFKYLDLSALPDDWTADHFSNLAAYNLGRTPPRNSPDYWKDGIYPWVSISDMTPYGVIQETAEKVSQQAFDEVFRGRLAPNGSLLMSFKLTIGRISRLGVAAFHNEAIISFKPDPEKISPEYLGYYLSQINYKDYQDTAIKGQTLNKGKLDSLEIALPPLPEQRAIAHTLTTVRRAIEAQERIIQTIMELRQALMQKLFSEGLRGEPQKETEIGLVPESWEVVELVSILREPLRNGHSAKAISDENGIRTLTLTAVTQQDFSLENTKVTCADPQRVREMWLKPGDIFIERANTAEYVGLAALYEGVEDFAIFPDLLIRIRVDNAKMRPKILIEWLLAETCRRYYKKNARSTAGNFPKIDQGTVEKTLIPVPSPDEQKELEDVFRSLDDKLQEHASHKSALQDLFHTLLHEMMTAKTRAHELEISL